MDRELDGSGRHAPLARFRRRPLFWVLATFVLWVILAGALVVLAGIDAKRAMGTTDTIRSVAGEDLGQMLDTVGGSSDDVDEEHAAQQLIDAGAGFERAHRRLSNPIVRPLYALPVLGRQLTSVNALSEAAADTATSAGEAVAEMREILEGPTETSARRLAAIQEVQGVLKSLTTDLESVDLGPDEALVGPVADARATFESEYERVVATLSKTETTVTGVLEFLAGPTDYLLLASNNAEMRAGSGMYLQAGDLEVRDGTFALSELGATQDMLLATPVGSVDPDVADLWGELQPGREWRNLNMSGDFTRIAPTAAAMWGAYRGQEVDGVIAVDVVAIARLLELTGPVTLESGETIRAETVEYDLMMGQYADFGDDRDARRERLGEVVAAVLEALNERSISASDLLTAFEDLGASRHLLMWSRRPSEQAAWESLGTSGVVPPDGLLLSVLNRGGNKLDPYLQVDAVMSITEEEPYCHVVVDVSLENVAEPGLPGYVAGPHPGTDLAAGDYKGIVSLTLPGSAGNVTMQDAPLVAAGTDGDNRLIAGEVRIGRGETASLRIEFDLPKAQRQVELVPSGRIPPTNWTIGTESFADEHPRTIELQPTS
ncbi:MAG: DUF4012 domain-containing protein [Microthrixaceae bacterium]